MSAVIETKNERKMHEDIDKFTAEAIVAQFAKLGLDCRTNDPIAFGRSMIAKKIRVENLMFPTEPKKDGLYFYRSEILVGFVHIPRDEGVSMVHDLLK